jgi:hypothetical protein
MHARCVSMILLGACSLSALADDVASVAQVTVASGPQAGKYNFTSDDACMIASLQQGKAPGFSAALSAEKATLSIDIPSIDAKQLGEFQVELVVADAKSGASRRNTASTTLVIDTRPDAALEKYQRDERGPNGLKGSGTVKLQQQDKTARLNFQGQTDTGIKLQGTVECRKVDREFGR